MLRVCAKRLRIPHSRLLKPSPAAAAGLPGCSIYQGALPQRDPLVWPYVSHVATCQLSSQFKQAPCDLTKTYVKRWVSEHFDTIIDPQFPAQTGLPMVIYVSQKQDYRPASIEVSQFYGNHHSLSDIFSLTLPRTNKETPRVIGDTGAIKLRDIATVCEYIKLNRTILLNVWEHGEDETAGNEVWCYYEYLRNVKTGCVHG